MSWYGNIVMLFSWMRYCILFLIWGISLIVWWSMTCWSCVTGKIADDVLPSDAIMKVLTLLSNVMPKAKLFPNQDLAELAFREPSKRNLVGNFVNFMYHMLIEWDEKPFLFHKLSFTKCFPLPDCLEICHKSSSWNWHYTFGHSCIVIVRIHAAIAVVKTSTTAIF